MKTHDVISDETTMDTFHALHGAMTAERHALPTSNTDQALLDAVTAWIEENASDERGRVDAGMAFAHLDQLARIAERASLLVVARH